MLSKFLLILRKAFFTVDFTTRNDRRYKEFHYSTVCSIPRLVQPLEADLCTHSNPIVIQDSHIICPGNSNG